MVGAQGDSVARNDCRRAEEVEIPKHIGEIEKMGKRGDGEI